MSHLVISTSFYTQIHYDTLEEGWAIATLSSPKMLKF